MATPSLAMIPSAYADSKVYSVLPNNGDGDFTFNRDSSATRVGQNGLIQEVGFFSNNKVSTIINSGSYPFNTFTDNGGGSYTCISTDTNFAGFEQPGSETFSVSVGQVYQVTFDVVLNSGSFFQLFIGSDAVGSSYSGSPITISATNSYSFNLTITTANSAARFVSQTNQGVNFTISNISLREIQGDQPRLNYDISNGVVQSCPSLLLEPASTNLIPYSQYFGSGGLILFASGTQTHTITNNYSISPDGTQNAIRFQATVGNTSSDRVILRDLLTTSAVDSTISVYAKSNTITNYTMVFHYEGGTRDTFIVTSEWQRFSFSEVSTTTNNVGVELKGDVTSLEADVSLWGFQFENKAYPTSIIPTNGISQTRAVETCNKTGLTNYIGQTQGSIYAEYYFDATINNSGGSDRDIVSISANASNSIKIIHYGNGSSSYNKKVFLYSTVGGSAVVNISSSVQSSGLMKVAVGYANNDYVLYVNGVQIGTDTSAGVPACSVFSLGKFTSAIVTPTPINKTKLYKTRLTNAQLQTLTT